MSSAPRLSYLAEVRLGRQRSPEHHTGEFMTPYLRSANVNPGRLLLEDVKEMNFPPGDRAVFALSPGDILMTEGSGSRDTVGATAMWNSELPGIVCFQNTLLRLRPGPLVDTRFLFWWCQHAYGSGLLAEAAGGQSILHLGTEGISNLRIPLHDLEEQRRIADFLEDQTTRIDGVITARQRQIESLVEGIEATAWEHVTGLDLVGERSASPLPWASNLPVGWGTPRVCQVAAMGTGHTPSRSVPEYWVDCDIPWLTTGDVNKFRHDQADFVSDTALHISALGLDNSAAVLHPRGTVALSRTASAGFSIIMDADMATSQDYATWTCGPALDNLFLLWCLRAMRRDIMGRLATGSTHKTIYFPDLMSIRVPLPPRAQQQAAVDSIQTFVAGARSVQAVLEESMAVMQEFRRSLISAAVSGGFDVSAASGRGVLV